MVVSAASGAVGQIVGQLAKIAGCRAVGIAGGAKKCAFVKDTLGFDACIDYKAEKDLTRRVKAACPNGVDVYFDNVGGAVSDAVLPQPQLLCARGAVRLDLAVQRGAPTWARACSALSSASASPCAASSSGTSISKYGPALRQMGEWVRAGRIKYKEDIVEGIEQGAARLHRPAARRELRQDAGEARAGS